MVNATKKWIFLRASSAILVPLMMWFAVKLALIYDKNFEEVLVFFTTQPSKFLVSLLMVVAFFYSALSISEIFEDYVENQEIKNVANKLLYLFAITVPSLTIFVIFKLSL